VTAYFPLGTRIDLSASPSSFLYTFQGYNAGGNSAESATTLTASVPAAVTASVELNHAIIVGGAGAALVVAVLLFAMSKRRGRKETSKTSLPGGSEIQ
jgi:cellobiose-specific phosphotransferase system component IIC